MSPNTSDDGLVYPRSVPQNAWYIHLEDKILHADGIEPPVPNVPRGESATYSFRFYVRTYVNQDPPNPPTHLERYDELLRMNEHAGSYIENTTVSNRVTFMEQLPPGATSLLVKLEPAYDTTARGVWGLLDSVEDNTQLEDAVVALDLNIMKLADAGTYDSRADLRSDLENGGP